MDTRHQVDQYMIVGIQLIFIVVTGACIHASSTSNEASCSDLSSADNDSNISSVHCLGKYMMESYVGKYDSSLDSDFQDFTTHKLHIASCKLLSEKLDILVRSSVLRHHLIGEGSHRRLLFSIRLNFHPKLKSLSEHPSDSYEVLFIEKLPYGIFADPFELQHLVQRGVFTDASVFGDTNLELPSFLSDHSIVEIHMDFDLITLSALKYEYELEVSIELPLHARYPALEESGYSTVEFHAPVVFLRHRLYGKSDKSCFLTMIHNNSESTTSPVVWKIPCGIRAHARTVSAVTFLSALLSVSLIVLVSVCFSDVKLCKTLKDS